MSRSFKKTPISGNLDRSDKNGKRLANRALRKRVKDGIRSGKEVLADIKEVSDPFDWPKDGKGYRGGKIRK